MIFKGRVILSAFGLVRHVISASLNALWLALCVIVLVSIAGSSAIIKNPGVILSISMIPAILMVMVGNFLASFSLSSINIAIVQENLKGKQEKLTRKILASLKINRIALTYVIASGLFARLFSSNYIIIFVVLSILATVYAFSKLSLNNALSTK